MLIVFIGQKAYFCQELALDRFGWGKKVGAERESESELKKMMFVMLFYIKICSGFSFFDSGWNSGVEYSGSTAFG